MADAKRPLDVMTLPPFLAPSPTSTLLLRQADAEQRVRRLPLLANQQAPESCGCLPSEVEPRTERRPRSGSEYCLGSDRPRKPSLRNTGPRPFAGPPRDRPRDREGSVRQFAARRSIVTSRSERPACPEAARATSLDRPRAPRRTTEAARTTDSIRRADASLPSGAPASCDARCAHSSSRA